MFKMISKSREAEVWTFAIAFFSYVIRITMKAICKTKLIGQVYEKGIAYAIALPLFGSYPLLLIVGLIEICGES